MKLLTTVLVAASLAIAFVPTAAAHSVSGTILVGHPLVGVTGGATELATPCDPASPLNGVDGVWFAIEEADRGQPFELTMDETLDVDIYFYDEQCAFLGGVADGFLGATETGTLPTSAAFVIVDGFAGTGGFTLTIEEPL